MNILMLSHGYPPTVSGVSLVVQKTARAMVQRGHRVLLICSSETRRPYESHDEGVRLIRVHAAPNPLWEEGPIPFASYRAMLRRVDEFQPDIVHNHDPAILAWQAERVCRARGIPLLGTCYYVPRFLARHLSPTRKPVRVLESAVRAFSRWFFGLHDHVVFATEAHRAEYIRAGLRVPTTIISNGTDTHRYCPQPAWPGEREDIESRYHLPAGKRILFVGRLAKDKEIDVLIEALWSVRDECDAHLLMVGRGDYHDDLVERIRELGMVNRCHLMGFLPEEDMPALYRAVDLFAIAATTEVQSLPTLQACASGIPSVAANAMALPELVHDGVNGHLAPAGDAAAFGQAFLSILCDADRSRRMGEESLRIAAPHDEALTFDAYEGLYVRMVDDAHAARSREPEAGAEVAGAQRAN